MRVEVAREVSAPQQQVWDLLVDWERQAAWMVDARAVEVASSVRRGTGVRLHVPTSVLGMTVEDVLEVTGWEEPRRLRVRHVGSVVSGEAAFELVATQRGTWIRWWEEVEVPLGKVGEFGARLFVRPYLTWLFRRSLDNFAHLCAEKAASFPRAGEDTEGHH